jgi:hypothetical protein
MSFFLDILSAWYLVVELNIFSFLLQYVARSGTDNAWLMWLTNFWKFVILLAILMIGEMVII